MKKLFLFLFVSIATDSLNAASENTSQDKAIIIYAPRPEIPHTARLGHHVGAGSYRVFLAADGTATHVAIEKSSGWADLDQAAVTTFRHWRAKPSYARSIVVPAYFGVAHP